MVDFTIDILIVFVLYIRFVNSLLIDFDTLCIRCFYYSTCDQAKCTFPNPSWLFCSKVSGTNLWFAVYSRCYWRWRLPDWCNQNAAHEMTCSQVIVILRLKSMFLYHKEVICFVNSRLKYYPGLYCLNPDRNVFLLFIIDV